MTDQEISEQVTRIIDYVKTHLHDSPRSARTHLDRLYGWVSGVKSDSNDGVFIICMYQTIEDNYPKD